MRTGVWSEASIDHPNTIIEVANAVDKCGKLLIEIDGVGVVLLKESVKSLHEHLAIVLEMSDEN